MLKIAHIINPVKVDPSSDLYAAQPVTFETMRAAREFAQGSVAVELYTAQFAEDRAIIPPFFQITEDLERSILDFKTFVVVRKYPLVQDVLDRLYHIADAEYFVYSNVDIALMPDFYLTLRHIIHEGYDAFVINRRTISNTWSKVEEIPLMYAQVGEAHPGYDCFIFRRDSYPRYQLGTACIGGNWIGRVLLTNLICQASRFKVFEDLHLTFHLGDQRVWMNPILHEYARHNEDELHQILRNFHHQQLLDGKPLVGQFLSEIAHKRKKFAYYADQSLSQNPIFVVGFPRSGTTLLQTLLATQDNIRTFPETHFFCPYLYPYLKITASGIIEKTSVEPFLKRARELTGLTFAWYEQYHFNDLAELLELTPKRLFENIVKHYLSDQVPLAELAAIRWLEKTPYHVLALDTLASLYPQAQFVAILRHPIPAVLSTKQYLLKEYTLKYLANEWVKSTDAINEFQKKFPDKIRVIKYEVLIQNAESGMADLCQFLNLRFDNQRLYTFSDLSQRVMHPFERWKRKLTTNKIATTANEAYFTTVFLPYIFKIQQITKKKMPQYRYPIHYPVLQRLYDYFINHARDMGDDLL